VEERDLSVLVGDLDVEALGAQEVVDLVLDRLHPNVALACSFQKEESVLLDMILRREPQARVFALDTHVLFPETYAVWREIEKRYGIQVQVFEGPSLGRQAAVHGDALWERNPALCCSIRKVAPLGNALAGLDGWITGVRRDQSPTRAETPKLGWDERHELWKASPIADWSDDDVWTYIRERELPVNELHGRGYASIGCTHCTQPGEGRDGRWSGLDKTECGLHA
jgi:phosphoadenosine phosphosulfate reductase